MQYAVQEFLERRHVQIADDSSAQAVSAASRGDEVCHPLDRPPYGLPVSGRRAELPAFWRWAYADLRSNAVRGVLAEYLVGLALDVDMTVGREEWAPWDLVTPSGIKVEVKCGAYVQAWQPSGEPSPVRYSGLLARSWIAGTAGSYTDLPDVRADVYVFALNICRDPDLYAPLDPTLWEFRVVAGGAVRDWQQRSVGLSRLQALGVPVVDGAGLPAADRHAAEGGAST